MFDDEIMEMYLEGQEIPASKIRAAIRKATLAVEMVPVTCGSSYRNKGVQKLLDAVVDYMPAPTDIEAIKGVNPKTEEEEDRHASDDEALRRTGLQDHDRPLCGPSELLRVYSGTLNTGSAVLNATKNKRERVGRLLQMHANHREDLETVYAGDIAAMVGLKNTTTGDTLCDEKNPIILESMEFPEPVIRVAIEPKTKAGQEKMGIALAKLAEEVPPSGPTPTRRRVRTIIAGMGELHLEIIVDRLLREFKVEANVGAPQVAYKETVPQEGQPRDQVQAPERWLRSVRSREDHAGAQRVRQGLRVCQCRRGRRHSQGVYPRHRRRYSGRHAGGRAGRLSRGGCEGHAVRWFLPRGGLLRNGL